MKTRTITLTIEVKARSTAAAAGIAQSAAEHLLDTFNDDGSLLEPISWQVLPVAEASSAGRGWRAVSGAKS